MKRILGDVKQGWKCLFYLRRGAGMGESGPIKLMKPPRWVARLRRFLLWSCPLAFLVAIGLFCFGILMFEFSRRSRWLDSISLLLFLLGMFYALFGLLLRMLLPLLLQFSLRGMLSTVLFLGACVSALVSDVAGFQIAGVVGLAMGLVIASIFSTRSEARYDWVDV